MCGTSRSHRFSSCSGGRTIQGRALTLVALLALAACGPGEPPLCEISDPLGSLVQVPYESVRSAPRFQLQELWRAGGLDDRMPMVNPVQARVGPDGLVAIPDFASGNVWLVDSDGIPMAPIGDRGQGPGQLLAPIAAAWTPEGGLLVLDVGNVRVERFDLESGESETLSVPRDLIVPVVSSGEMGWFDFRSDGTAFMEIPIRAADSDEHTVLYARGGPGDLSRETLWEQSFGPEDLPSLEQLRHPDWPRPLFAVGEDAWAIVRNSNEFQIAVFTNEDEPRAHVCVTDPARIGHRSLMDAEAVGPVPPGVDTTRTPSSPARMSRVSFDRTGHIWVQRTLPLLGSLDDTRYGVPGAAMDILISDGGYVGRLELPEAFRFQDAVGDTVWGFEVGELGEVWVVAGELVEPEL